jgi:hypothetical protein
MRRMAAQGHSRLSAVVTLACVLAGIFTWRYVFEVKSLDRATHSLFVAESLGQNLFWDKC